MSTLRIVDTTQITKVLTLPEDSDVPVWYQRTFTDGVNGTKTWYYRDWQASDEDIQGCPLPSGSEEVPQDTSTVFMMHVRLPSLNERGVPLLLAGFIWTEEYADFLQSRVALQKLVMMFAQDLTVEGGSRAVEAVSGFFNSSISTGGSTETNPAPPVGSPWIHNNAVRGTRNPLGTGAGDAQSDASMFMAMIGMAGNVYPHYLGMGDFYRLATATAMERPTQVQWELYQTLWADTWRSLAELVLRCYEVVRDVTFETKEVDVSQDAVVEQDLTALSQSLNTLYLAPAMAGAQPLVPYDVAVRLALQVLNVQNPDEVMKDMEEEPEEVIEKPTGDGALPGQPPVGVSPAQERAIVEAALRVVNRGL